MILVVEEMHVIFSFFVWITPVLYWIRVIPGKDKIGVLHFVIPGMYCLLYFFIPSLFLLYDEGAYFNVFLLPFIAMALTFFTKLTKYDWARNFFAFLSVIPALACVAIIVLGEFAYLK